MSLPFYKSIMKSDLCDATSGKCGEITFCLQVGKRFYALNCLLCPQICIQWDAFINHMEDEHEEELQSNNLMEQNIEEVNVEKKATSVKQSSEQLLKELPQSSQMYFGTEHYDSTSEKSVLHCGDPLMGNEAENCDFTADPCDENQVVNEAKIDQTCESISDQLNNEDFENYALSIQPYHIDDFDSAKEADNESNWEHNNEHGARDSNDAFNDSSDFKLNLTQMIIKYYKEHSFLWSSKGGKHNTNDLDQREAYKDIAKQVNERMNTNLKWFEIKEKIDNLKSKFHKEHKMLTEFPQNNPTDTDCDIDLSKVLKAPLTSWLYEEMRFLIDHIGSEKKRSKRGTKAVVNTTSTCYLPLAKLSMEDNQQLIELYKSYPCLWDVNHIGYRFKNQRLEGLQELLDVVNQQMDLQLTIDELQKKLCYIRSAFTQEKHRQLECERLQTEYKPLCLLYAELLFLKDSLGPFKCEFCAQLFNGPDQYKMHKSTHNGLMPYSCPICQKGFMKVGNCTVHLRRHTKDYQFACNVCGNKYATSTDLNVHTRQHTGEKPYICDVCGQSFRTWTLFDSHKRRHDQRRSHMCTICFKGFYESNKLKDHMKSHLNVRDKICLVCGKSFTCTKYLSQHKQIHAEKKAYSCKICAKTFAQYSGLSGHMKTHGTAIHAVPEEDVLEEV